jgi:hypothetical protein
MLYAWCARRWMAELPGHPDLGALRPDAFRLLGAELPARHLEVVVGLQVEPELRAVAEVEAEPERRVDADAPSVGHDLAIRLGEMPIARASRFCQSP